MQRDVDAGKLATSSSTPSLKFPKAQNRPQCWKLDFVSRSSNYVSHSSTLARKQLSTKYSTKGILKKMRGQIVMSQRRWWMRTVPLLTQCSCTPVVHFNSTPRFTPTNLHLISTAEVLLKKAKKRLLKAMVVTLNLSKHYFTDYLS